MSKTKRHEVPKYNTVVNKQTKAELRRKLRSDKFSLESRSRIADRWNFD